jgi:RNA polymerase sigma-70 factor (ECF subfamily)
LRLDCLPPVSLQQLATELAGPSARLDGFGDRKPSHLILQDAFNRLPPSDREILAMRHFERLTREELATVLEFPVSRASHYYLTAVRRLHNELARQLAA